MGEIDPSLEMGLCKLLFTWWRHRVSAPSFERTNLLLLLHNIYLSHCTANKKNTQHILNPLNKIDQSSLGSMQSKQLWKMSDVPTFE